MHKTKTAAKAATMPTEGIVEGYASTFDRTPDSYGDVVAPGAFTRTLEEWAAKRADGLSIPLLYGHSTEDPLYNIGKVTDAYEDERGLFVRAEFDADNPKAQYVRKLAQEGRLYQFSFAYAVRDAGEVELDDGTRAYELRDLDLFEVSLVQIPANQNAVITGIKGAEVEQKGETHFIELKPRIEGLTDEQRAEYTKAMCEAMHNGIEIGLKAGRRNSKADADEMRRIRSLANEITQAIDGLLADEEDAEPDGGPSPDANAEEPTQAKAEEPMEKDADELADALAYANALLGAIDLLEE